MSKTRKLFWFLVGFLSSITFLTCSSLPINVSPDRVKSSIEKYDKSIKR